MDRCCRALLSVLLVAIGLSSFLGCGRGGRTAVYPAEGQIVCDGKPLAGAQVVFYPHETTDNAVPSRGQTDSQGRFRLSTYDTEDGAPEGQYAVTVVHYPVQKEGSGYVPGPNALPTKYSNPKTTDLRVRITKENSSLPALVLQAAKTQKKASRS